MYEKCIKKERVMGIGEVVAAGWRSFDPTAFVWSGNQSARDWQRKQGISAGWRANKKRGSRGPRA